MTRFALYEAPIVVAPKTGDGGEYSDEIFICSMGEDTVYRVQITSWSIMGYVSKIKITDIPDNVAHTILIDIYADDDQNPDPYSELLFINSSDTDISEKCWHLNSPPIGIDYHKRLLISITNVGPDYADLRISYIIMDK